MTDNRELDILVAKTLGIEVNENIRWRNCPHFSTDIAAAMKLVPPAVKNIRWFTLQNTHDGWKATIIDFEDNKPTAKGRASNPAEATARAWLAWKGVDYGRD